MTKRKQGSVLLGLMLIIATLTVLGIFALNRFIHQGYVTRKAPEIDLRLMTWNVGKVYLPWESRAASRDLRHIARVIQGLNPHIIALQELKDKHQLGQLIAILGRGWRGSIPDDVYDRRAALLIRRPGHFFEIPTTSGRIAQGATIDLRHNKKITTVSLHLDAFDARRRLSQAEEIILSARRKGNDALYLLGDFNLDPRTMTTESVDRRLYAILRKDFYDSGENAGATTIFSRRLDYIFYQDEHVKNANARVIRGQRIHSMDHDPYILDITLR